jgi:hypothetical protein
MTPSHLPDLNFSNNESLVSCTRRHADYLDYLDYLDYPDYLDLD